ncbi:MAG: sulfite exporter TauE/SafE family protein [Nitrososphaeraceae archaeon]
MIDILLLILAPLFFIVSFFYSSVGFGGGSSYIALLILVGVNLYTVPQIALALNILVSSIAFINYLKAGHMSFKISVPLLISVPFAFIAGSIVLPEDILITIFAVSLFAASITLLLSSNNTINLHQKIKKINLNLVKTSLITSPIGACLGSVAGLVGIGGGIWLSPILILTGLANPKQAAAAASLFILTNSISGFVAHSIHKEINFDLIVPLAIIVIVGSIFGSRIGAFKFDHSKILIIIAVLVALAGINLTSRLFY